MRVTYIFHSCYVVECEGFSMIFDFYKDTKQTDGSMWVNDYLLNKKEDLYVFCSHSHPDHYNNEILRWKERKKNVHFIFSNEVAESTGEKLADVVYLDKCSIFEDENLMVKAFGSTDIGGSFLIKVGEKYIFHAGDLNNWHWSEEVPSAEALIYENNYLCELELMAEDVEHLFLAMFPVDPRLGKNYMKGAEQFVSRIQTNYFLPMHFSEQYESANAFADIAKTHNCKYLTLSHQGQSFKI
ncbi:MAG: MBL fold metallo-hydrolase [Dysgonamonadaceae bacterium]|nr:MBL fold metallo-hydrolase [Dysgonamonadaceae bacterium]MDD3310442.1 MBL fold metallo-hydrolase [Dysgonamonadaceae bacterium]MDD3901151.1 MBL fold metallo-hydrolase [Dysgonamonadaceae bacterium]MDD4399639.1 MBL fold metallo-hydrolase [Dysgonamonadaceae bacterium]